MDIKKVGVVGCGTMGAGIAQICAQTGYPVIVSEINEDLLKKGLSFITGILDKGVSKGTITAQDKESALSRIQGTTSMQDFRACDIVIEAALEEMNTKKKIFVELDKICPPASILATNTSCLSVTDIAMVTSRPEKVVGLHFFNPVPVMKLIELVNTLVVSPQTIQVTTEFGKSLGKEVIVTKDAPGFIVNRLLIPFILNAVRMYENGVAGRDEIDTALKLGASHPIGPLALADLIGLDVVAFIANAVYEETKDNQFIVPIILKKMLITRRLGRKTKKGFYDYN